MKKKIWFMGGLNSQKDIITAANDVKPLLDLQVFASHPHPRYEILQHADVALIEPAADTEKLDFILRVIAEYRIDALHTGRNCLWFEQRRATIENSGVRLTTGARDEATFVLADNKVAFAAFMAQQGLPVVPSLAIASADELRQRLAEQPFDTDRLCIKPVTGIYGLGFWRLDAQATPMACFDNASNRCVHPELFLAAMAQSPALKPMVLMPWLPGPERSVDMLVENGEVIAAVGRCKDGALQHLHQSGEAFELAVACAQQMKADGLVNIQTRDDHHGRPLLLEINLRPSGGLGYTRHSGINLPGLFAQRQCGAISLADAKRAGSNGFRAVTVRATSDVEPYPSGLDNLITF